MSNYLHWDRITIEDFNARNIENLYNKGYVFTRRGKGIMDQTRSLRINLSNFRFSSENRRIFRKVHLGFTMESIPYKDYSWKIGKLAKDFYDTKFGKGTFSANKVKELLTDKTKTNFNSVLEYRFGPETAAFDNSLQESLSEIVGFCIVYTTDEILHYSYPFYKLNTSESSLGMRMMLGAITWAQDMDYSYVYLGSAQRPNDKYKLQFKGLEWFDGAVWRTDFDELKKEIAQST